MVTLQNGVALRVATTPSHAMRAAPALDANSRRSSHDAYRVVSLGRHLAHLDLRVERKKIAHVAGTNLLDRQWADLAAELDSIRDSLATADGDALGVLVSRVRTVYSLLAGLEGALEWHSPPRLATWPADAAVGPVHTDHDYQRDRNGPVSAYELAWLDAAGDTGGEPLRALGFASGMAALSTILAWQASKHRPIVVTPDLYHETRFLLAGLPSARLSVVSDRSVEALADAAAELGKCAMIIDAQSNDHRLVLKDWPRLLQLLGLSSAPVDLIIDTTLLSATCQPFRAFRPPGVDLISVESLTKFGQLGLDRVAGGIVLARRETAAELDRWREHGGTGLTVSAVRQLPWPCRAALAERCRRHEANAGRLAAALQDGLRRPELVVNHPLLPGHPSREIAVELDTAGSLVAVTGLAETGLRRWVARMMDLGARRGVRMAEGTSFGFDACRFSVVDHPATPFLRISAGDGPEGEIDAVARVVMDSA